MALGRGRGQEMSAASVFTCAAAEVPSIFVLHHLRNVLGILSHDSPPQYKRRCGQFADHILRCMYRSVDEVIP